MKRRKVIAAVDQNGEPATVIAVAWELAAALGARLGVVHGLPMNPGLAADVLTNPAAHPGVAAELREREQGVLGWLGPLLPEGSDVEVWVGHGHPADVVLEAASGDDVVYLVTGTHGRQGLARAVLGSVAGELVARANVPVVTVRFGGRSAPTVALRSLDLRRGA